MVDNLSHIKVKLVVHHLQTNCHICIDEVFLITEFHFILGSRCIDLLIGNFRSHSVLINHNLINRLHLTWKFVAIEDVLFNTWEGLVDNCFQYCRFDSVVFDIAIIYCVALFFFSGFLIVFHTFLVISFDIDNGTFAAVIGSSFKNDFLLIFEFVINCRWQGHCVKEFDIIVSCIELSI